MPLREAIPYGLRDVKIAPLDAAGLPGTLIDLPNSQVFSFTDSEDFEELRGDDKVVAKRGKGATVGWDLESGGISLEAYVVIAGGSLTISGTTPNQKKTYQKKGTDQRPDFWVEGQSMSESGGDFHCRLPRCKADDDIEGSLEDGTFFISKAGGTGLASYATDPELEDLLYQFDQNETAEAITQPTFA